MCQYYDFNHQGVRVGPKRRSEGNDMWMGRVLVVIILKGQYWLRLFNSRFVLPRVVSNMARPCINEKSSDGAPNSCCKESEKMHPVKPVSKQAITGCVKEEIGIRLMYDLPFAVSSVAHVNARSFRQTMP
jgi:hypothetical protein